MKIISQHQMDKKHFQDDSPLTYLVDKVRLKYQNALQFKYFHFANIHQRRNKQLRFFWYHKFFWVIKDRSGSGLYFNNNQKIINLSNDIYFRY